MNKAGKNGKLNRMMPAVLEWGTAILVSVFLINIICFVYLREVGGVEREGGALYAVSQPGKVSVNFEEGYGINRTDNNGYTNTTSNLAEDGYVLIMGNSMTRGSNNMSDKRYVQQLNQMVADSCGGNADETAYVYSISRGGALFAEIASGYDAALAEFPKAKAVVIQIAFGNNDGGISSEYLDTAYNQRYFDETQTAEYIFSHETAKSKISHSVKNYVPIIAFFQNRRMDNMKSAFDGAFGSNNGTMGDLFFTRAVITEPKHSSDEAESQKNVNESYMVEITNAEELNAEESVSEEQKALTDVLTYLNNKKDIPLIIVDLPQIKTFNRSDIVYEDFYINEWQSACEAAGVTFISMREEFEKLYDDKKVLPYGYSNTSPATGHLSNEGNEVLAKTLYRVLREQGVIE